jgi:hypothetical protein
MSVNPLFVIILFNYFDRNLNLTLLENTPSSLNLSINPYDTFYRIETIYNYRAMRSHLYVNHKESRFCCQQSWCA